MRNTDELVFFFLGISVGVIAALLIAPYSGEQTRQFIRNRVDEGRERAGEIFEKGKDLLGRQSESISSAVGQSR